MVLHGKSGTEVGTGVREKVLRELFKNSRVCIKTSAYDVLMQTPLSYFFGLLIHSYPCRG